MVRMLRCGAVSVMTLCAPCLGNLAWAQCGPPQTVTDAPYPAFSVAPTRVTGFVMRDPVGTYMYRRQNEPHRGVDLVATGLSAVPSDFEVYASGAGTVAYAGNNDPAGYGYTVVIDHHNGEYTLYAHLAERAS